MFFMGLRTEWGRWAFDKFKLTMPVLGPLFRKAAISRFARTLGTLVGSGVPILQALTIVKETAGNVILGHVPGMILDDVFLKQSEIAVDVKMQLEASMQPFGYGISKVLITDVIPDDRVKASMNSINAALRDQEAGRALPFATFARATGRVVGSTRFGNIEFWTWAPGNPNQRGEDRPDAVEIGWTWLGAAAQRTAVNTEAKLLMLTHAFEEWRVHRVNFMTDSRNERSRNAILRLGARFDGILRAQRPASDGGIRDTAAFSIRESEWPMIRRQLQSRLDQ